MTGVLIRRHEYTDTQRGKTMERHRDKTTFYKPRIEAQKKPTLLAPDFGLSSLRSVRKVMPVV